MVCKLTGGIIWFLGPSGALIYSVSCFIRPLEIAVERNIVAVERKKKTSTSIVFVGSRCRSAEKTEGGGCFYAAKCRARRIASCARCAALRYAADLISVVFWREEGICIPGVFLRWWVLVALPEKRWMLLSGLIRLFIGLPLGFVGLGRHLVHYVRAYFWMKRREGGRGRPRSRGE